MEENVNFLTSLTEALDDKLEYLDKKQLPKIKEEFRVYHTAYRSIYNLVIRKGLVQEDPYKYDEKISEVTIPDKTPFIESERVDKMSIRLAAYDNQLEFLTNYYQYSADFLNLQRIKNLIGLIRYFKWENFSERSDDHNTRGFALIAENILKGSDKVSSQIIQDAIKQLHNSGDKIQKSLKTLASYHKEKYKRDVREYVIEALGLTQAEYEKNPDKVTKRMKQKFAETLEGRPFYSDLIHEILKEEFSPEGAELKEKILKGLTSHQTKRVVSKKAPNHKENLLEAVRELGRCNIALEGCLKKIVEADEVINEVPNTFGAKLREFFHNWLYKGQKQKKIITVEIFDPASSITKPERIDYNNFLESLQKKVKIFIAIANKGSTFYQKLQLSEEEKIHDFLQKQISEMQKIYHQLEALDTYYKTECTKEQRRMIRGIKVELTTINNALRKSNRMRHEYVAEKEEQEQMKKLGINT